MRNQVVFSLIFAPLAGISGCGALGDFSRIDPGAPGSGITEIRFAGDKRANTSAQVSDPSVLLHSGVVILLQGIEGTLFSANFVLKSGAEDVSFTVPNGTYRVLAFGFENGPFQGAAYCGFGDSGQPIRLTGGTHTISVYLSPSGCSLPAGDPALSAPEFLGTQQFLPLTIVTCVGGEFEARNCTQPVSGIRSLRIKLLSYWAHGEEWHLVPEAGLESACIPTTSSSVSTLPVIPTGLRVPVGSSRKLPILPTTIQFFGGEACQESVQPLFLGAYVFPFGIFNSAFAEAYQPDGGLRSRGEAQLVSESGAAKLYLKVTQ